MPLETQGKILRVLIDQTFHASAAPRGCRWMRGSSRSTTRDLRAEIEAGRFREDLYHRLNVVPVRVPSLAERRDDIPLLVAHFMKRLSAASGLPMREIGDDAMAVLQAHDWPGNVRQLRNIVERLLILASDDAAQAISADLLPADLGASVALGRQGRGDLVISLPLARSARNLRARISGGADQPLRRQHLAHRRVHRHGALGAAPASSNRWASARRRASTRRIVSSRPKSRHRRAVPVPIP